MASCFRPLPFRGCFQPRAEQDLGNADGSKKLHTSELCVPQIHPAAAALHSGRLAISFSGGGFLLPYFLGVADSLISAGVLRPHGPAPTALAGASAGSLIAASLACGITPDQVYNSFLSSVNDCRTNGSYRRLNQVLIRQLEATLPADAADRCSGVATVGITRLFPRPRSLRVSSFHSRTDLIEALMASCHIPGYFNGSMTGRFRGRVAMDGGVTELLPVPVTPHDFLLKVSCFPRDHVARLPVFNRRRALKHLSAGITPDAFGPWPYSLRDMLAAALHPASDDFLLRLRESGRSDGGHWLRAVGLAALPPPPLQPQASLQSPLPSCDSGGWSHVLLAPMHQRQSAATSLTHEQQHEGQQQGQGPELGQEREELQGQKGRDRSRGRS